MIHHRWGGAVLHVFITIGVTLVILTGYTLYQSRPDRLSEWERCERKSYEQARADAESVGGCVLLFDRLYQAHYNFNKCVRFKKECDL